jgi:hypothetical protein
VLLAYGDDGKPLADRMHLDNGLGGSLLLELALSGRVDIHDKKFWYEISRRPETPRWTLPWPGSWPTPCAARATG